MRSVLPQRRVPFVPQMEVAECGAACLAMVATYLGKNLPLSRARELCGVSRDGVTALGIVKAARSLGLGVRPVKASVEALAAMALPAVLHWEFNHFVVLERVDKHGGVLVDPACGRRHAKRTEIDEKFTGIAISFTDKPGPRARRDVPSAARTLALLARRPRILALVLGTAIMLELLAILIPTGTQVLIDHVIRPQRADWLWPLVGAVAVATCTQMLLTVLRDRAVQRLSFALDLSLMTRFVDHMLALPLAFLEQRTAGDLLQRVRANETLRQLSLQLTTALLDGVLLTGFIALMLAYSPTMSAAVLSLALARIVVVQWLRRELEQGSAAELAMRGREAGALLEGFSAPEFVKAFATERLMVARYVNRLVMRLGASTHLQAVNERAQIWSAGFDGLTSGAVLLLGGHNVIDGSLSLGAFMGFVALEGMLHAPLASILAAFSSLVYARGILMRVDDVLQTPRIASGDRTPSIRAAPEISLEEVTFQYAPGSRPVCAQLSLHVRAGEKVAIVGPSGTGKSTLLRLMLGMNTPSAGTVRIAGVSVREIDRRVLLREVGVVQQDPFFFADTVFHNLTMFDAEIGLDEIKRATALACIDDVIERLPYGYDTPLGTNAGRLSGGQRQRLALARALVHRPAILLLDEATSSLDEETEARVHANLAQLACTRVLIAHRLNTVRDADRVLVFDEGRFVQEGTYEELCRRPGWFAGVVGSAP